MAAQSTADDVLLDGSRALVTLAQRTMELQCTIQDGQVLDGDGKNAVHIEVTTLKSARLHSNIDAGSMKEKKRIPISGEPIVWKSPFAMLKNVSLPCAPKTGRCGQS